jgi:excisionase family DNA binding protein
VSDFENKLRALIADIIRDEVRRAVADVTRRDEILSTEAAAAFAKVSPGTIRRWVKERRLARANLGRHIRVSRNELERMLKAGPSNDLTPEQLARKMFG